MGGFSAIGVDLGGTEIKAVAMTETGQVVGRRRIATGAADGREAVLTRIASLIETLRSEVAASGHQPIGAVGVAVPGVLDMEAGRVELTVALTPDWNGFAAADALRRLVGLPITIMNDAQAATVGEHVWGAGRGHRDLLCVTVGTGIGGGLIFGDRLYTGSRGMAGHIGHITVVPDGLRCGCGNRGCLETVASATAITRAAKAAIDDGDIDLRHLLESKEPSPADLANAAARGNGSARRIFETAGTYLGQVLGGLVCTLNPTAIVIGGGVSQAGDALHNPIRHELRARTTVFTEERGGVALLPSTLGGDAGAIGSAAWVMTQRPS